jgi:chromosome partitioning protein
VAAFTNLEKKFVISIAIINQKGGVGKTTVSLNLAAALSLKQKKVLLIDLDPQGHSTIGCGKNKKSIQLSLFNLLSPSLSKPRVAEVKLSISEHLDLIPSNITLSQFEPLMLGGADREYFLRNLLKNVTGYDFVIIDAPPSLGLLTINALLAATKIIVPLELSPLSFDGVESLGDTINLLQQRLGHRAEIKYVINRFQANSKIGQELWMEFLKSYEAQTFAQPIPATVRFLENLRAGNPFRLKNLGPKAHAAIEAVAEEVLQWSLQPKLTATMLRQSGLNSAAYNFSPEVPQSVPVTAGATVDDSAPASIFL